MKVQNFMAKIKGFNAQYFYHLRDEKYNFERIFYALNGEFMRYFYAY